MNLTNEAEWYTILELLPYIKFLIICLSISFLIKIKIILGIE